MRSRRSENPLSRDIEALISLNNVKGCQNDRITCAHTALPEQTGLSSASASRSALKWLLSQSREGPEWGRLGSPHAEEAEL